MFRCKKCVANTLQYGSTSNDSARAKANGTNSSNSCVKTEGLAVCQKLQDLDDGIPISIEASNRPMIAEYSAPHLRSPLTLGRGMPKAG